MTQYRTAEQVKKFDIFKIVTFGILVVLLLLAYGLLRPNENPPAVAQATTEPTKAASATAETADQSAPAATEAESDAAPAPMTPTLDSPGEVMAGEVTLTGTGEPGSEVEIVVDGKVVGKTTVGSDGKWSFTADLPKAGEYQVSVQRVAADGKKLAASEAIALTVAAVAEAPSAAATEEAAEPAATVESAATEEAAAPTEMTTPALDSPGEVTAGEVTLTGTGEPGSEVQVVVDGKVVGQATVDKDGKWSFATDLPKAGEYQISVQSVDADGKVLAESDAVALTVAEAVAAPALDSLGELTAGEVTLTGTGEPGSEVEIVVDGKVVGKATVDSDGKWSFATDLPDAGEYQISVQSVDADGKALAESDAVALTVAEAVAAPALDSPGEVTAGEVTLTGTGEPGSEVQVVVDGKVVGQATVDKDGKWSFATDLPDAGEYQISVQSVDADGKVLVESEAVALTVAEAAEAPTLDLPGEVTAGEVTLTGTGEPGSEVEVVADGKVVGQATVDKDGKWSFATDLPDAGEYQISVQSVDADGKVLAESEAVALTVAEAPTLDSLNEVTAGEVTLTGTGEPGSEVEVVVDGKAVGKTTVGRDGKWSFATDLPDAGEYQISVQSVDADGKALAESDAVALTVAEAAEAPTLDSLDEVTAGEVTLTGTGEPGSEVEIVVDGKVVGQATVDRDGKWTFPADLSKAGDYKISVQSVGEAGSAGAASAEMSVAVAPEDDGQAYIVQADDWLSKLALKFYSDMTKYPAIVEATNAKAQGDSTFDVITNPDLIEIGQKLWIPAEAP